MRLSNVYSRISAIDPESLYRRKNEEDAINHRVMQGSDEAVNFTPLSWDPDYYDEEDSPKSDLKSSRPSLEEKGRTDVVNRMRRRFKELSGKSLSEDVSGKDHELDDIDWDSYPED